MLYKGFILCKYRFRICFFTWWSYLGCPCLYVHAKKVDQKGSNRRFNLPNRYILIVSSVLSVGFWILNLVLPVGYWSESVWENYWHKLRPKSWTYYVLNLNKLPVFMDDFVFVMWLNCSSQVNELTSWGIIK